MLLSGLFLSYPADALACDVFLLFLLAVVGSIQYFCGERTDTWKKTCRGDLVDHHIQLKMQYSFILRRKKTISNVAYNVKEMYLPNIKLLFTVFTYLKKTHTHTPSEFVSVTCAQV